MDEGSMRVSDDEREQAVVALREHLLAGRLTLEEFSERAGAALRAKVAGELARVQEGLPAVFVAAAGSRRKPARFTSAVLGHVTRRGRFRLRKRPVAASVFGDLDLDLREAAVDHRRTSLAVLAAFGNIDIYVPEGINVEMAGIVIFGHRTDWGRDVVRKDVPVIRVRTLGFAATIDVWRVPGQMQASSYRDIFRALEDGPRQISAESTPRETAGDQ